MAKKYLINGDVLNAESVGSSQSHNNCFQTNYNFKMLITPERKVPQRSDASQNDHKSKGYPYKTGGYRHQTFYFIRLFKIRLNSPSQDGTWSTLNAAAQWVKGGGLKFFLQLGSTGTFLSNFKVPRASFHFPDPIFLKFGTSRARKLPKNSPN